MFTGIIVSLFLTGAAPAETPAFASEITLSMVGRDRFTYRLVRPGTDDCAVNLRPYMVGEEMIENYIFSRRPPLNPTGQYFPFVANDGDKADLLLVDAETGAISRHPLGPNIDGISAVKWVSATRVVVDVGVGPGPRHFLYDIVTSASRWVDGERSLVFDASGDNYASIWDELIGVFAHDWETGSLDHFRPMFLRYNGYWVYPKAVKGFRANNLPDGHDYRSEVIPDASNYAVVKSSTRELTYHYMFSKPVFIADSPWACVVEEVFPHGDPSRRPIANLVAVDAHLVTTNPPRPEDIGVMKLPIPPVLFGDAGYRALSSFIVPEWNATTNCIEIWRYTWGRGERVAKLGEVPVTLEPFRFGEYRAGK